MKQLMWWQDNNNKLTFSIGVITGMYKYLMDVRIPIEFPSKLIESGITAAVCGLMGVVGKEIWVVGKRAFIAYFKKRKTKK